MPCIDLKAQTKSNDYQRQLSNSKKNISRKTTSRTMRLENSLKPSCMHTLLRQAKDTTKVEGGKSKSPTYRRSKSGGKIKIEPSSRELKYKSEKRLSLKIGSNLRKLDFFDLVQDEDENLVYPSASTRVH